MSRALRILLGGVVAGTLVWLTGGPAAAHASLVGSDPEQGAVVATLPDEITLAYNEPIRLESDGIAAFDAEGDEWEVDAVSRDNLVVITPVDDPGEGTVVIAWKVTSEDGHEISGAIHFSIGAVSTSGPSVEAPEATTPVTVARFSAAGLAALGLLLSLLRRSTTAWNAGLAGAVLLGPLHSLATDGRPLRDLTDWVAWIDGLTSTAGLLALGAYAVAAAARRAPLVALIPSLALLVGAGVAWPQPEAPDVVATPQEPTPSVVTGGLGDAGTVELTVTPSTTRDVTLAVRLLAPDGTPLAPFAPPTLTVGNGEISLGEAELTESGPGVYEATLPIPLDGEWTAQVSVRVSEFDNPVVALPFTL